MNRKDRLKITSTPDRKLKSKNIYQQQNVLNDYDITDNQIEFTDINNSASIGNDSLFTSPESLMRMAFNYFKVLLAYLKIILPYGIVTYFIMFHFYTKMNTPAFESDISELTREIDSLKQANATISISPVQVPINLCKIEHCTTVEVSESDLYKHGFLGFRKSASPYIIFSENTSPGECLAFLPKERTFTIKFSKNVKLDNFNIFHPETGNKKSALKNFQLLGFYENNFFEIGKFEYDITKENCQTFKFPEIITDRLVIKILDNHGHKSYTTIYKVYALGINN
ncbi:SUN domain-containing protein [Vairimorpha necatrix]|uniref:SUN domain-containing protein n=1 Tax=Vairimorpha necatrix TaxID=6039 RepID=A0AAX4J898_9MICR